MKKDAPGCCGCGVPALAITIYGCGGLPLAGAAVLIKQAGVTIASYTSSGAQHTIPVPGPGTYTVEASKARFEAGSVTGTAAAGVTTPVTITLAAATGYRCCSTCPDPYPTTLYFQYAGRTITLTYGTSTLTGTVGWHGTAVFARTGYRINPYGGCLAAGTIDVPFFYTLTCPAPASGGGGLAGWRLDELVYVCGNSGSLLVTDESDPDLDTLRLWRSGRALSYGPCVVPLGFDVTMTSGGTTGTDLPGHASETPAGSAASGTLAVTVTGCNGLATPGATVTATLGTTTVSATTDPAGSASLTLDADTWSVTVSRARFATSAPADRTITAGATASLAVALTADSAHVCVPGCALPIAKTLVLTDPAGAHTITWDGTAWVGCYLVSTNQSISFCGSTARSTNNIPVRYALTTGLALTASYPACTGSTPATEGAPLAGQTCAGYPWASATAYAVTVTLAGPCTPLWTGTMKLPSDALTNGPPGCLVDGAITVTE